MIWRYHWSAQNYEHDFKQLFYWSLQKTIKIPPDILFSILGSTQNTLCRTTAQELHASPHLEHIPILSYLYISIYRTSWPYMDMWASMKFWPLCRMDQGCGLLNRSVYVSISNVLAPSYSASRGPSDLFRKVGKRKGPLLVVWKQGREPKTGFWHLF